MIYQYQMAANACREIADRLDGRGGTASWGAKECERAILALDPPAPDRLETLSSKLRRIISHATGGALSDSEDVFRSADNLCVQITAHQNRVFQAGLDGRQRPGSEGIAAQASS